MRRIALFNDNGHAPHIYDRAVSSAHDRLLARAGATVAFRSTGDSALDISTLPSILAGIDIVIVNGGGPWRAHGRYDYMSVVAGTQALGLPTLLVNASFQREPDDADRLRRLDDLTVVDAVSSMHLQRLDVPHRVVFDSMLEGAFDDIPSNDLRGRVILTDRPEWLSAAAEAVSGLAADLGDSLEWYLLDETARVGSWTHAVADFRRAALIVTATLPGLCLALMAGVPFVALGSATSTVAGVLDRLPGDLRPLDDDTVLPEACAMALHRREAFEAVGAFVRAQRPLTTFERLVELQK